MVKNGQRGILMLVVLRQWRHPERVMEVRFDGIERSMGPWYGAEVFFGRKPSASAPAAAMPVGIVTLLGASLCYLSHTIAPGENPRPFRSRRRRRVAS
jgi:hypothetical protein